MEKEVIPKILALKYILTYFDGKPHAKEEYKSVYSVFCAAVLFTVFANKKESDTFYNFAITTKNKNGNYMRLIHNKNVYALGLDQYTWNEVPNSHQVKDRADKLKRAGLWQKVRDRYLEKKNMYLFRQDHNHPSFVVYVEAVNEVYNRYFNRGGGYSVQSIF